MEVCLLRLKGGVVVGEAVLSSLKAGAGGQVGTDTKNDLRL